MRIGIDLDNTIIFYDDAFVTAGKARGLLPDDFSGGKVAVRDALRKTHGEETWQALQGYVYGKGLEHAALFPGLADFLRACKGRHDVFIVSHKTEFGHFDPERINLRDAARQFLNSHGFFSETGFGLQEHHVYFAATRAEKAQKIAALHVDCFIDDLVEVFEEPHFPNTTRRILFNGTHAAPSAHSPSAHWMSCASWAEITHIILGT